MRVSVLSIADVSTAMIARWRALADSALEPNPFFEPSTVLPAATLLEGGPEVGLLIAEEGEQLLLAMPIVRARRYRKTPVPALVAWQHLYCFLGTPLLAAQDPTTTLDAALHFLRRRSDAAWLVLDLVPDAGPVASALNEVLASQRAEATPFLAYERPIVRRRTEPSYLEGRISGRHLKRLYSQRRQLAKQLGGQVDTVDKVLTGEVDAVVQTFIDIEAAGWKGRDGGAFACRLPHAEFFRRQCREFAAVNRLQLFAFGTEVQPVALQCNLIAGETVFHYKVAYDESYARYSPGLQAELDMLREFHSDERLRRIDSCTGPLSSPSHQLYPDRCTLQSMLIPLTAIRGRLAARGTPTAGRAYHQLRNLAKSAAGRRE